jgi:hypothetical protein
MARPRFILHTLAIPTPMRSCYNLLPPLWQTIAVTVATLATNWIWGSWLSIPRARASPH